MALRFSSMQIVLAVLGLLAIAGAGKAVAQTAQAPSGLTLEQQLREERRAERRAVREAERTARLEGEIAFLRARLTVTSAQATAWEAFADALREQHAARSAARLASPEPVAQPLNFLERLGQRQAVLNTRSRRLNSFLDVLTPLYAVLSVEQRLIADRFLDINDGRVRIEDD